MSSSNAARVQGAGPNCTDGDPILVCVQSMPPPVGCTAVEGCPDGEPVQVIGEVAITNTVNVTVEGCVQVEDCPGGDPVRVDVQNFPAEQLVIVEGTDTSAATQRIIATTANELFGGAGANASSEGLYTLSQICMWRDAIGGRPEPIAGDRGDQSENSNINSHNFVYIINMNAYVGNSGNILLARTPTTFKTVATAAAGNTALWTPAVGKKFRLMRYQITITGNAAFAAAAILTVSLFDGAAGATGQVHSTYIPLAAGAIAGENYRSGWIDLGNGFLSAAANNVLNVNLSAALAAGTVRIVACGTEE